MAQRMKIPLLVVVLLSCSTKSAPPQSPESRLQAYMVRQAQDRGFSGAVLVGRGQQILHRQGYGFANIEQAVPNRPTTKFRIGSMSKQLTAMAVLVLQERRKLRLEDSIGQYLPALPPHWQPLTVHQLLTHTSGLMHSWDLPDFERLVMGPSTPSELIARFATKPLLSVPGERYHYSGLGYFILAQVIETVSGSSYQEFLRREVFDPLRMNETGDAAELMTNGAIGYRRANGRLEIAPALNMRLFEGGGSLYSTIDDMWRWHLALAAGRLISKESYAAMYTPSKEDYAYGWRTQTVGGRRRLGHAGALPGFTSIIRGFPEEKVCLIVLSNAASDVGRIADGLEAIVFDTSSGDQGR
ncbi:MAG: beta-lactamase family protein [Acidobacteria bacterium]|nr:beta-lactamase family protein [Acidobacteriota bacterium]